MYLAEQMEVRHLLSADGAPLAMDDLLRSQLSETEVVEYISAHPGAIGMLYSLPPPPELEIDVK